MISCIREKYNKQNNIKFGGKLPSSVNGKLITDATDALSIIIKKIETGGIFVDIGIVDLITMIIPRTWQAFHRNQEEIGHLNYKAGVEEAIREIFSGPSLFVIPMIFIALAKKQSGAATNIQFETLNAITASFKGLLKKGVNIATDKIQLKKDFYKNILNEAFASHRKSEFANHKNINDGIKTIIDKLLEIEKKQSVSFIEKIKDIAKKPDMTITEKIKGIFKDPNKPHIEEITKIVSNLNKSHGLHIDNSHNITLKYAHENKELNLTKNIGAFILDLTKYSTDKVEKIAEKLDCPDLPGLLDTLHKTKIKCRKILLASTVLVTSAFVYAIPLMYKRNKEFPGTNGLKDCKNGNKANSNVANKSFLTSPNDAFKEFMNKTGSPNSNKSEINTPENDKKQDKSPLNVADSNNDLFKPFTNNLFCPNSNTSDKHKKSDKHSIFSGILAPIAAMGVLLTAFLKRHSIPPFFDKLCKQYDFNGHNVPYAILGFYVLGIMLGARLWQARDADERREVATRDFAGMSVILFAIPALRNLAASWARNFSGFPISKLRTLFKDDFFKAFKEHLNPTTRPLSFENIHDIYSGVGKYKNKIVDFSENIDNHGGDLRKIFDFLNDESKEALNKLAEEAKKKDNNLIISPVESSKIFKTLTKPFRTGTEILKLPQTNKEIIDLLDKAKSSDELKTIIGEIDKEGGNNLIRFAEVLKSVPEALSIAGVAAFLGWFLPWFNIHYTKSLYKNKHVVKNDPAAKT